MFTATVHFTQHRDCILRRLTASVESPVPVEIEEVRDGDVTFVIRAAEHAGASDGWVIRRHILPNVSNTIITNASLLIPGYILFEAALAFLGVTDPGIASWGKTISAGRGDLANAPWIATIPGIFLFFTILGFNFLGDALGDALDPRRGDT